MRVISNKKIILRIGPNENWYKFNTSKEVKNVVKYFVYIPYSIALLFEYLPRSCIVPTHM